MAGHLRRYRSVEVKLLVPLLGAFILAAGYGQDSSQASPDDIYFLDLGIIIEPESDRSAVMIDSLYGLDNIDLVVGKQPAGAVYIASTKELQAALAELSGKIVALEQSLNEDILSMQAENERLRSLIKKLQTSREQSVETGGRGSISGGSDPEKGAVEASAETEPEVEPSYREALRAYRAGFYQSVIWHLTRIDPSVLSPSEKAQALYWLGDAYFQIGQVEQAAITVAPLASMDHPLRDDALVIQGLAYKQLGQPEAARERFQTILEKLPGSDYFRLAQMESKSLANL